MGRHASRRAANSANRKIGINATGWFAGQSFTSAHRESTIVGAGTIWEQQVEGAVKKQTPSAMPVAPDAASTAVAQQLHRHLSDTMPGLPHCEACGRTVFTLVEGRCFQCGRLKP